MKDPVKDLDYCNRQIQIFMLRAQWWLASVSSGHYKQREIFHAAPAMSVHGDGRKFTDDEKLADAMATAKRHIELAAEFSDNLAEANASSEEL